METNYAEITENLLRIIAKDNALMEQFANGLEIDLETFEDYIDNVEFPIVGRKTS